MKAKKSEHTKEPKFFCKECGTPLKTNSKTGLCPICAAKKRRIVENRPSADTLLSQIKENGMSGTGRLYGVSDRAVAK